MTGEALQVRHQGIVAGSWPQRTETREKGMRCACRPALPGAGQEPGEDTQATHLYCASSRMSS